MNSFCRYIFPLVAMILLASCSDDDYEYPAVKLEFLTANANEKGLMETVMTDDGKVWRIVEDKSATQFDANSQNRIIANMEQLEDSNSRIYSLTPVFCANPIPANDKEFEDGIISKPVEVLSIWQGLSYINMVLQVKTFNSKHVFKFVEEEIGIDENGNAQVKILLYHNSDIEQGYNTKRAYASIPAINYLTDNGKPVSLYFRYYDENNQLKEYGPFVFN